MISIAYISLQEADDAVVSRLPVSAAFVGSDRDPVAVVLGNDQRVLRGLRQGYGQRLNLKLQNRFI